jgi:nucleoside-specific outer membrane channel protein Tsx
MSLANKSLSSWCLLWFIFPKVICRAGTGTWTEISMKRTAVVLMIGLILVAVGSDFASAAIWQSTSASLLYSSKDQSQTIITLDHASGWKYGDHFFFFDIVQPFDVDTHNYGEWHPRLSFGKMTGKNTGFGFVKDVLIATELNVGTGWRAYLYGVGFDLDIPHFKFFALNLFIRDDMTIADDSTWQISPSWNLPFVLAEARFEFLGFIDIAGPEGGGETHVLAQPQFLLDLGNFAGNPGNFYAGIEYQYWKNKYGIKDLDDKYVQIMGKWVF